MLNEELALTRRMGVVVRQVRRDLGMTQKNLAERAGVAPNYLALVERGVRAASLGLVARLARVLGIDVVELFGDAPIAADDEQLALGLFRSLSPEYRKNALDVLRIFSDHPRKGAKVAAMLPGPSVRKQQKAVSRSRPRRRA